MLPIIYTVCTATLLCLLTQTVSAAPIPGLYNSGVSDTGTLLTGGSVDPHYRLVQSPDPGFPGPDARVVNDGYPIPPWLGNGPTSKWIAPQAPQGTGNRPGDYRYRLTFDLTGLEPASAVITGQWTSDNAGQDVLLNGASSGFSQDGNFGGFAGTFTIRSGFVDGTNTLDFVVNNAGDTVNPTGLRVELSGTADPLLEPGTPPSVLQSPTNQTAEYGGSVTFYVSGRGARPLSYQWRFKGEPLPNATNSTLTLNRLSPDLAGDYDVIVSNPWGTAQSAAATLTVAYSGPERLSYERPGPSSRRTGLVISEVMYHPRDRADGKQTEFIELYNSNPFAENIGGYRLSGAVDYTFPANTTIAGNGYLVIATKPEDVEAVYGISGVLGGFTNSLPNTGGTIRLRKAAGAVILEIPYSDSTPWPIAADGAGHSMVLARPSHGEGNAKAWVSSARIGGSPGAPESWPAQAVGNVRINELLAHSAAPALDFVELFNASPVPADLSGCFLTDERNTNKFRIANGTMLAPSGLISFDQQQLGFALSAGGETVYLVSSNEDRVIDAVRFGGQPLGGALGRYPNGAESLQLLASPTPGNLNMAPLSPPVVITEIMYHPISGQEEDEFIELYNPGSATVDLGGWRFVDGISFTFPQGTVLAGGAYLVLAQSATNLLATHPNAAGKVIGNFGGNLSDAGERLALARPEYVVTTNTAGVAATNVYFVTVHEVTYADGGSWGAWADGGGSSLELTDPRADGSLPANWADSDETAKAPWTFLQVTGRLDLAHTAVGAADQLQIFLQGPGETLIDNVEVLAATGGNRLTNSTFESGTGGWFFQGTQRTTSWSDEGYQSAHSLHLRASERGDHVANRVRAPLSQAVLASGDGILRARARWLRGHPEVLFRLRGGHLEMAGRLNVPRNLGTPGERNSRATANGGPVIHQVSHRPVLPQPGEEVRVTARIADPDGIAAAVMHYRLDPGTQATTVPMNDEGTDGDLLAGDGVYSGIIPGQDRGAMVAFHIEAVDGSAQSISARYPASTPERECLVRIGETIPPEAFGTYRVWLTKAAHDFWGAREKMSNEDVPATFVYGGARVIYEAGAHYAGSSYTSPGYTTPTGALCGYDVNFPEDDAVLGETHFTLDWPIRDDTNQREQLMFWFLEQYGLPNCYRRYVHLVVNGVKRGTIYDDIQQPGGDMLSEWFPDDDQGSLYKSDCWNEFDDVGSRVDPCILNTLENFTTTGGIKKTARYRWNWRPRAIADSANDFRDLFTLVDAVNPTNPPVTYPAGVSGFVDVAHWMRTFAMNDLASFWDAFGNPNNKNTYIYKPHHDRWKLLCFDFDVGLGVFNDPTNYALFPAINDPAVTKMYNTPAFVRLYWQALDEAVHGFFQTGPGTAIDAILDAKYAAFQANGIGLASPAAIKTWITGRRNFLLTQLNTVAGAFNVTTTNVISTNRNLVTITGTAPVRADAILVDGFAYPITWTSPTAWRVSVPVAPGAATLLVQAVDRWGQPLPGASRQVTVEHTGVVPAPEDAIVISEIMYNPAVPEASYIEIYNRSPNLNFDISGWRVNGLGFTFPAGSVITNGQLVVLVKNRSAFASVYGHGIAVFGEFSGQLDDGGETLTLLRPGSITNEEVVVDRVTYDDDPPWPVEADGNGAALQLIDAAQDNNRLSNWSDASGWRFFSYTGSVGSTTNQNRLSVYFDSPGGEVYLDDIRLVRGTVAGVGTNYVQNAGFEEPLTPAWILGTLTSNSVISSQYAYSGVGSLHFVQRGSSTLTNLVQEIPPATTNTIYTLSFWWRPGAVAGNLKLRLNANFQAVTSTRQVVFTPGALNSTAGSLPPYPSLWLNEVQPSNAGTLRDNVGEADPWLEVFYGGDNALSLEGFMLSDNPANLAAWPFAASAAVQPNEFRLVWADGESEENTPTAWHTGFRLNPAGGMVILSRMVDGAPQVLDVLRYPALQPGAAFGSFPDGQLSLREAFSSGTPGSANLRVAPLPPIFINEWMAANTSALLDPDDNTYEDWFELFNAGTEAVDLAGFGLTDVTNNTHKFVIPANTVIAPGGFLLVWADEDTSQNTNGTGLHVNFRLSQSGEQIALYEPGDNGRLVDLVTFGPQTNNISQGRWPDGGEGPLVYTANFSPGQPNRSGGSDGFRVSSGRTGNAIVLTWPAAAGARYRVQAKAALSDAVWIDLTGDITAMGAQGSWSDTPPAGLQQRFYRIVLQP